eukprot:TRINITY_DN4620_c0_g1_i1.p2 TRINITY_DN4620_c0_g1~~TRINITY_DN4620_c0_g1_i1.p2  ORF type:complete len:110 (+),score=28.76 TRINITY_DN4620_c0_g1_i1:51-380(+)
MDARRAKIQMIKEAYGAAMAAAVKEEKEWGSCSSCSLEAESSDESSEETESLSSTSSSRESVMKLREMYKIINQRARSGECVVSQSESEKPNFTPINLQYLLQDPQWKL